MRNFKLGLIVTLCASLFAAMQQPAHAEQAPGVTDKEIKIGQTLPLSGPASAYSAIGKTAAAYFNMINELGGINGRRIVFLQLDDGYSPPKTMEQTRKLVEKDNVALIALPTGSPTSITVRKYLNDKKVPQILIGTALFREALLPAASR